MKANDVANFFIEVGSYNEGTEMTNARINKLLYFAQGWHLALKDSPLFDEEIEAWGFGPVVKDIYFKYKNNGDNAIKKTDDNFNIDTVDADDFDFLSDVFAFYANDSTYSLINKTHEAGTPWSKVYAPMRNNVISKDEIKKYFKENNEFKTFNDVLETLPKEGYINNEGYTVLPKDYEG